MGLDENDHDALFQKAISLLNGPAVSMNSTAGRRMKEEASAELLQDNHFGRFFVHAFPAQFELAIAFFTEAPQPWIMAANDKRRKQ